ncbi:MAG: c-type cytochrome biogenesis protein CcmI [Thiobacillus sp.]|nr:c-type cytochrome biogenesis protein CcmI [Thiobacillus sp.]
MTPFWTVSLFWVAAVVCVAVALVFVLPPLLRRKTAEAKAGRRDINIAVYRDQLKEMDSDRANGLLSEDQFQTAKLELEARLAEDALAKDAQDVMPVASGSRKVGFSLAALLPAAAFGLYFLMGNPAALTAIADAQANPNPNAVQGEHDIMKMIQQVEEKTRQDPNDAQAWSILAKTYSAVGHWPEALKAWEKALTLRPDEPAVMTGYAEALAISNNRVLEGKPMELVQKALEKDPNDIKGLELSAIGNYQQRNYAKAIYFFKQLYKQLPPESPYAQDVLAAQQEAEGMIKSTLSGMDDLSAQGTDQTKDGAGATISGVVDIAPALKAKVSDKDVVFLFARGGTSGAPVAAIRGPANAFPLEFELNDSLAMNPESRLSKFKEVTLIARVAKSGDVKGAPGDLEGSIKMVKVGAKDVKLLIDSVRP